MESLILENLHIRTMESESVYKPNICEKCNEPTDMQLEMLGKVRIVPRMCKCKREQVANAKQEDELKQRQYRLEQVINNSLMDKQFRTWTFENWDFNRGNPKMLTLGKRYVEKFQDMKRENMGLMIYGPPGNGKTYLSACIANALLDRLVPTICVSINSLLERIKKTFNTYENEGVNEILNAVNNADLLIIDDLGTETPTEWSRSMVYNIIDSRYRMARPMIITTNISKEALKDRYYERTYNRIIEICTPVENNWKSIREDKGKEKVKLLKDLLEG